MFAILLVDFTVDVVVRASRRAKRAEAIERVESVMRPGPHDAIDLCAHRICGNLKIGFHRLEAKVLRWQVLLLPEQVGRLRRESIAASELDGPLQKRNLGQTFRSLGFVDPYL